MKRLMVGVLMLAASGAALAQMPTPEQIMEENDLDKNGEITKAEAEKAATPLLGFFDMLDADKDGKITLAEVKAMMGG